MGGGAGTTRGVSTVAAHTKAKLYSVLDNIEKLKHSEFPQKNSLNALLKIERDIENAVSDIEDSQLQSPEVALDACADATAKIARNLVFLGFILRSTNVRNSFELHAPLNRLAKRLLGEEISLIISSEWKFSPFTYPKPAKHIDKFILIGLPASESSNALIVPLAGHELGHSIWYREKIRKQIESDVRNEFLQDIIGNRISELKSVYPIIDKNNIFTDIFFRRLWLAGVEWSLRQLEEIFCDVVGLRTFGTGFLYAFQYLVAPRVSRIRPPEYPSNIARVAFLERAASKMGLSKIENYKLTFIEENVEQSPSARIVLKSCDAVVDQFFEKVYDLALEVPNRIKLPMPSLQEAKRISNQFELLRPVGKTREFSDIVHAGWIARMKEDFWTSDKKLSANKNASINELVLKSLEIYEITKAIEDASDGE